MGETFRRGSRHEYEDSSVDCPQGCADPMGGMRLVTHHTGETDVIEIYGEAVVVEQTERYYECRICGWVMDA